MALTIANTNYNGELMPYFFKVFGVGNQVMTKGCAKLNTGISTKLEIGKFSQTVNPLGAFTEGTPESDTQTTTYSGRELIPEKMTLFETISAVTWHNIWAEIKSQGSFTELELNQKVLQTLMELSRDGVGTQISKLFFQGDKTLTDADPLGHFNGICTRLKSDINAIKPSPSGNITAANYFDILGLVWSAIPDKFIDDPDFKIIINTTDYKTMMNANTALKRDFVGVFGMGLEEMFQEKKIVHLSGMKRHHIIGAKATPSDDSNLHLGVWFDPESEPIMVNRKTNSSKEFFMRIDYKADANYAIPEEIVFYEPS